VRVEPGDEVVHHLGLLRLVEDLVVEPLVLDQLSFLETATKLVRRSDASR
jgi:hypothetical protein